MRWTDWTSYTQYFEGSPRYRSSRPGTVSSLPSQCFFFPCFLLYSDIYKRWRLCSIDLSTHDCSCSVFSILSYNHAEGSNIKFSHNVPPPRVPASPLLTIVMPSTCQAWTVLSRCHSMIRTPFIPTTWPPPTTPTRQAVSRLVPLIALLPGCLKTMPPTVNPPHTLGSHSPLTIDNPPFLQLTAQSHSWRDLHSTQTRKASRSGRTCEATTFINLWRRARTRGHSSHTLIEMESRRMTTICLLISTSSILFQKLKTRLWWPQQSSQKDLSRPRRGEIATTPSTPTSINWNWRN